jgi:hypothetical protein
MLFGNHGGEGLDAGPAPSKGFPTCCWSVMRVKGPAATGLSFSDILVIGHNHEAPESR